MNIHIKYSCIHKYKLAQRNGFQGGATDHRK